MRPSYERQRAELIKQQSTVSRERDKVTLEHEKKQNRLTDRMKKVEAALSDLDIQKETEDRTVPVVPLKTIRRAKAKPARAKNARRR